MTAESAPAVQWNGERNVTQRRKKGKSMMHALFGENAHQAKVTFNSEEIKPVVISDNPGTTCNDTDTVYIHKHGTATTNI